jgi:hypothetical protein
LLFGFILLSVQIKASTITISSSNDWFSGTSSNIDAYQLYGSIQLLPSNQLHNDLFDQSFLKFFWNKDTDSFTSVPSNNAVSVSASGIQGVNNGVGIQSIYAPITSTTLNFYSTISPISTGDIGSLYLSGIPWSQNYFSVAVSKTSTSLQVESIFFSGITGTTLPKNFLNIAGVSVCISMQGTTFTSYLMTTWTASWVPLTPNANTWIQITQTTMTLSPVNYSVGLGSIAPGYVQGTAQYSNFQIRPYASSGIWQSQSLDRGGVPSTSGTISWVADTPSLTGLQIQTQTSADGTTWSGWSNPYGNASGSAITSPMQRYIEILATLSSADPSGNATPVLHSITVNQPEFGTGTLLNKSDFKITPNPVKGNTITLTYLLSAQASSVRMEFTGGDNRRFLDVQGPTAQGQNTYTIDASQMANDVYLVKVTATDLNGSSTVFVKKIVLSR